jgi:hypothetical protein
MNMIEMDKRTKRPSVPLSGLELYAVDEVCARLGTTRGAWMRDVVLAALAAEGVEVVDTARRPARRRANYPKSSKTEGQQS